MNLEEAKSILHSRLSQMQGGITNYKLLQMLRYDDKCIVAVVSYTWHLNGYAKPVDRIQVSLVLDKESKRWLII